jgi:hypothetical protein
MRGSTTSSSPSFVGIDGNQVALLDASGFSQ